MKFSYAHYLLLWCSLFVLPLSAQVPFATSFTIQDGADDAEESVILNVVNLTSSDLEMVQEITEQVIGLRFNGVTIPQGATINSAFIQFTADETDDVLTNLNIQGELAENAAAFTTEDNNISTRTPTNAAVAWNEIPAWEQELEAGPNQQTPDLTAIVQEIVDQPGWAVGNAMGFIIDGEGKRVAVSFNNGNNAPAQLVVNYDVLEIPVDEYPINSGSLWSYDDSGEDLGTAWKEVDFDDSAWAFGQGKFGYGDGNEATTLDFGGDPDNKHITYYFRKRFNVTNAADFDVLNLNILRDDGAIVYINGTEVARTNMPTGAVDYLTLASSAVGGADEDTFFDFELENVLQEGENVIAVEVHQANPGSSDLGFDLNFAGEVILPPAIQLIHNSLDPALALVDIYIDVFNTGNFVKFNGDTPIPFRFATDYLTDLPEGTHSIAVSPFGQEDFMWSATEFTVETNKRYIVMATGVRNPDEFETTFNDAATITFKFQINEVPSDDEVEAGEVLLLLYHGTTDLPNIRLVAVNVGDATGDLPDGLPYGFDILGGGVPAASFPIVQVTDNLQEAIYGAYKADLVPFEGQVITLMTSGLFTTEGDPPGAEADFGLYLVTAQGGFATLLPPPDPPQPGQIQIIHNSPDPDLASVDLWVNGANIGSLNYLESTGLLSIPVGINRVAVSPSGVVDTAWSAMDLEIESFFDAGSLQEVGFTYTAIAYGARNTTLFENAVNEDINFNIAAVQSRLEAANETDIDFITFHGAMDAPAIDVILDGQVIPLVNDQAYGAFSPTYISLPADDMYQINLTDQEDNDNIIKAYLLDATDAGGQVFTVFATGLLEPFDEIEAFALYVSTIDGGTTFPLPEVIIIATGEQLPLEMIRLFPNPALETLNLQSEIALDQVELYNSNGVKINSFTNPTTIPIDHLTSGSYFLKIWKNKVSGTLKFIKK